MLSSRYYYYLMYLNAIACLLEFTGNLIYAGRYSSSLSSLVVALLLMSVAVILFESRMKRFRGETFTQIMSGVFSNWFQKVLLLGYILLSFWVGLVFLVMLAQIVHLFVNPDLSNGMLFCVFLLFCVFVSGLDSKSFLFLLEIVVVFQAPFCVLLFLIVGTDVNIRVDFMVEAATYIRNFPSYHMIAAGTFLFGGFLHLLVFNEHIVLGERKIRHLVVCVVGAVLLVAFYFIPIGYFGLAGISSDNNVWFTTANSINIQYFFIERFLLIFIMVQLGISFLFVILCWHSLFKLLTLVKLVKLTDGGNGKWVTCALLLVVSCLIRLFVNETSIRNSYVWFLNIKLAFDLALIGIVVWCARHRSTS